MVHATTRMNLENMLSEDASHNSPTYYLILFI